MKEWAPSPCRGDSAVLGCLRHCALLRLGPNAQSLVVTARIALGIATAFLAACAAPQGNDTFARWTIPVVTWKGANPITLPMDTISMDGRVMFYVVELSINGNKG